MVTHPMHGPVALAIFWIWLGFAAAGAMTYLAYRLLRPWLNKLRKPPSPPAVKYATQLQQRMRKKPSHQRGTSSASEAADGKPSSRKK